MQGLSYTLDTFVTLQILFNSPPVASDDTDSTTEDAPVAASVLGNDSDPNGNTGLQVTGATILGAAAGQATVNSDGTITFGPQGAYEYLAVGEWATVGISDTLSDPSGATGTGVLTVNGANDAPMAVDDSASTTHGTPVAVDVLGNDTDPDTSAELTASGAVVGGGMGSASFDADGRLVYDDEGTLDRLGTGQSEIVTVTYTLSDNNGGTDTGSVSITISGISGRDVVGTNKGELIDASYAGGLGTTEGDDTVRAGNGDDRVLGLGDADALWGGNGNDALFGGRGRDSLYRENGNDTLDGGAQDDLLDGGRGDDRLTGGAGADVFLFGRASGSDVITDFDAAVDAIRLVDGGSLRGVALADLDGDGTAESTRLSLSWGTVLLEGQVVAVDELRLI